MTAELKRAQLLRERGRHPEAVAMLLGHLAAEPEDPWAFIELALNRMEIEGQLSQALEDARTATGLMPGEPFPPALQAGILTRLEREKEALPLAQAAISLDPEFGYGWCAKGFALAGLKRWSEAEVCAREALGLDPEDNAASNLLAHVLRMQNRLDEADDETARRLERDPENAFSFANAGWAALQRGQVKEAEKMFREALRLDPEMEHAREGLKHSFRARSAFFRIFLRWSFFMQRFTEGHQMMIIIGLVIGFRVLRTLFATVNPLLVIPLAILYYLFIFGSWLSSGLANFLLLRDPVARLSLDRGEKVEGFVVGMLFFGGIIALLAGLGLAQYAVAVAEGVMMIAAIPATMVFTNPSPKGRFVFGAIGLAVICLGAAMTMDVARHPQREVLEGASGGTFTLLLILAAGATWLGMVPSLRNAKPA